MLKLPHMSVETHIPSPSFPAGFLGVKCSFVRQNVDFLMPQNLCLVWRTCEGLHIPKSPTPQITSLTSHTVRNLTPILLRLGIKLSLGT